MPDLFRRLLRRSSALRLGAPALLLGLLGCGSTEPSPFSGQLESAFWGIELNHHAVLLSMTPPWDTLPLTAMPRNDLGQPLTGVGAPQYSSTDIQHVTVTPNGVLHAIAPMAPGAEALVTVELTVNNVTHADTVYVRVMETSNPPPVLDSFSIHPVPPDSAKSAVGNNPPIFFPQSPLVGRSFAPNGVPIDNLPVAIRSSDPTVATVDRATGFIIANRPGTVTFYASTTAFGITKVDTLPYRIGWPLSSTIELRRVPSPQAVTELVPSFIPSEIKVGTGAIVNWAVPLESDVSALGDVEITFADAQLPSVVAPQNVPTTNSFFWSLICAGILGQPADCIAGNFTLGPSNKTIAIRGFLAPGTYEYHSTALGIGGRVIVVDER